MQFMKMYNALLMSRFKCLSYDQNPVLRWNCRVADGQKLIIEIIYWSATLFGMKTCDFAQKECELNAKVPISNEIIERKLERKREF